MGRKNISMTTDNRFYEMQDRDTPPMFGPSLRQAVADEREVLALDLAVAALDLSALEARYAAVGHPAYPPAVMLKVLLYGYSLGLRASRQLERACKYDACFRFLAGGLRPDHNSLCRFRHRQAEQLPALFAQTVHLCQQAGLVALGVVALDGTKLRANRAPQTLRAAQQQLTQALQEAEAADQADGVSSAAETPEPDPEECAFLQTGEGIQPAYNMQLAVDGAHQVILACGVDTAVIDSGHLAPLTAQVTETCGAAPQAVVADGSYAHNESIAQLEGQGVAVHVPVREPGQAQVEWVEAEQAYRCLAGHFLRPARRERGRIVYQYAQCRGCPQQAACGVKGNSKRVYVWPKDSPIGQVRARLQTTEGQAIAARRKGIIEPLFGKFKHNWGIRRLLLRGVSGARIEWSLLCVVHNLQRWAAAAGPTRWRWWWLLWLGSWCRRLCCRRKYILLYSY